MTTAREYLDRYNAAAVKLNKPTIKGPWKSSTAAIQVKCNAIETEVDHVAKAVKENKKANEVIAKPRKTTPFSAAQIIMDFNIDPKQGRALLRKHNVKRTPEAIRAFFKSRQK